MGNRSNVAPVVANGFPSALANVLGLSVSPALADPFDPPAVVVKVTAGVPGAAAMVAPAVVVPAAVALLMTVPLSMSVWVIA